MFRYPAILLVAIVNNALADDTTASRDQNSVNAKSQNEKPTSTEIETINFEKGIAIDSKGNVHKLSDLQKEFGEDFNPAPRRNLMIDPDQEVMIDGALLADDSARGRCKLAGQRLRNTTN